MEKSARRGSESPRTAGKRTPIRGSGPESLPNETGVPGPSHRAARRSHRRDARRPRKAYGNRSQGTIRTQGSERRARACAKGARFRAEGARFRAEGARGIAGGARRPNRSGPEGGKGREDSRGQLDEASRRSRRSLDGPGGKREVAKGGTRRPSTRRGPDHTAGAESWGKDERADRPRKGTAVCARCAQGRGHEVRVPVQRLGSPRKRASIGTRRPRKAGIRVRGRTPGAPRIRCRARAGAEGARVRSQGRGCHPGRSDEQGEAA